MQHWWRERVARDARRTIGEELPLTREEFRAIADNVAPYMSIATR